MSAGGGPVRRRTDDWAGGRSAGASRGRCAGRTGVVVVALLAFGLLGAAAVGGVRALRTRGVRGSILRRVDAGLGYGRPCGDRPGHGCSASHRGACRLAASRLRTAADQGVLHARVDRTVRVLAGTVDHGGRARGLGDLPVVVKLGHLVAEGRHPLVERGAREDGEQEDQRSDQRLGDLVGHAPRGIAEHRAAEAEQGEEYGLAQADREDGAEPLLALVPQVAVDEPGVHDGSERDGHVDRRAADQQLDPHQQRAEHHDEVDGQQLPHALRGVRRHHCEDVLEEWLEVRRRVGLEDGRDLVNGLHQQSNCARCHRVDDELEEQEADRLGDCGGQGDPADRPLGHGDQPQGHGEQAGGREDDRVLLQEASRREVDLRRVLDQLQHLAQEPDVGLGELLEQEAQRVRDKVDRRLRLAHHRDVAEGIGDRRGHEQEADDHVDHGHRLETASPAARGAPLDGQQAGGIITQSQAHSRHPPRPRSCRPSPLPAWSAATARAVRTE